jgi:hypothetical protein
MARILPALALALALAASHAEADPCGFVPPVVIQGSIAANITRTGDQLTFVFFKDGIEDIVINPAFKGRISEFGMLVPFPSPPALRKVADDIFQQVANAVDPPKVRVDIRLRLMAQGAAEGIPARETSWARDELAYHSVRVLKEEAVGMYQAATLEAGSAEALKKWMTENGYVYPKGMDESVSAYVRMQWCFVAIKARVGTVKEAGPKPGITTADNPLPPDAEFSGALHATGFRFKTDRCVVPMRLGTYNDGRLFNRVFYLSDAPSQIKQLPTAMVKKQIDGKTLVRNLTGPLPLEVIGGTEADLPKLYGANWEQALGLNRDPAPYNAKAKELFLTDLLAASKGRLSHTFEEEEKRLHLVAERMGLKGTQIDEFIYTAIGDQRARETAAQIGALEKMTLSVVEGDFPREILRQEDLAFAPFALPAAAPAPAGASDSSSAAAGVILVIVALLVLARVVRRRAAVKS